MASNVFRREAYIYKVEGIMSLGRAPGIRIKFCDRDQNGRPCPFVLSNGVKINPSPSFTLFRGQRGDVETNDRINKEQLERLGYVGDHNSAPTPSQFTCCVTRENSEPVEIVWEVTDYGNEVKSIGRGKENDGSEFFTGKPTDGEKKSEGKEPWEEERTGSASASDSGQTSAPDQGDAAQTGQSDQVASKKKKN